MKNFIVYDIDGVILRTGYAPDSMVSIQAGLDFVIEGIADDLLDFVEPFTAVVTPKTTRGLSISKLTMDADGVDSVIISGLKIPSVVRINKRSYDTAETTFEFSVKLPGDLDIEVSAIRHLPETFLVVAA